ncbi:MAG: hypothetical protein DLM65_10640, partial [Candidatus Aeolococcus gillhamiae]
MHWAHSRRGIVSDDIVGDGAARCLGFAGHRSPSMLSQRLEAILRRCHARTGVDPDAGPRSLSSVARSRVAARSVLDPSRGRSTLRLRGRELMYSNIYVALDNSEHSDAASTVALELATAFNARVIGMHVYAARMHDYRFKQMEYTLPEEYQDEAELLRQRRIHDSLITTGLELISDSYTDVLRFRCLERGVEFTARMRDGRNWEELVADVDESEDVDVVVMGALGTGAVKESQLGSVTERVARRIRRDLLIIRTTGTEAMEGGILVAIDGSPQSFAGLRTALALGRALGKRVEAVAVYDPYLHYAVFNGIVDVLSEKASKIFRFKEQEALHEEIIDTGLAKIYESHLRVARATAAEQGVDLPITLLDGKAFERVLRHARETK